MRRIIAFLLMLSLLCGTGALAESTQQETADIQELVVTREDQEYTLQQQLIGFLDVLRSEELRELLNIQDVQEVVQMVVVDVVKWLLENRETTMKILAALDVTEYEREMVSRIWDSADCILAQIREYQETESGEMLREELLDLGRSTDWKTAVRDFAAMGSSQDLKDLLNECLICLVQIKIRNSTDPETVEAVIASQEKSVTPSDLASHLITFLKNSPWFQQSMPALLDNPLFSATVEHLFDVLESEQLGAVGEELRLLLDDAEVMDFISKVGMATIKGIQAMVGNDETGGNSDE